MYAKRYYSLCLRCMLGLHKEYCGREIGGGKIKMKFTNKIMFCISLFGISLLLMIPIFNIWYASVIFDKNLIKQLKSIWEDYA